MPTNIDLAPNLEGRLLLTNGEIDNNAGTNPIQSDRLFEAMRANGKVGRLVKLPLESHHYSARASQEHLAYELIRWFDKYVKDGAAPVPEHERAWFVRDSQ